MKIFVVRAALGMDDYAYDNVKAFYSKEAAEQFLVSEQVGSYPNGEVYTYRYADMKAKVEELVLG